MVFIAAMAIGALEAQAQLAAVKTNVLLWGNLTPNLSLELVTGREPAWKVHCFTDWKRILWMHS